MTATQTLASHWDESAAAGLSAEALLLYRSNLLGSDLEVTNFAGGNPSAKLAGRDPLSGKEVEVLWVKGSGGDLGSMGLEGFATLYQEKLLALEKLYRGREHEDEIVPLLAHCTFALNPRAPSIDTPLHAYLPFAHIDHMHPDAVIALAAARDGERLTQEIYAGAIGWLPWQRPGFDLGLRLRELCRAQPEITGIVLGGHGLFTWSESSRACYEHTLETIRRAETFLTERRAKVAFGGMRVASLEPEQRAVWASRLVPPLRGEVSQSGHKVAHFDDSPDVMGFVGSQQLVELARLGTSCPDHFLRTKIRPLVLDADPARETVEELVQRMPPLVEAYRRDYTDYYERHRREDSPAMRDPSPVVVLVPGVGMLTFARDKATARVAGEFYVNAIHVMRGASEVSEYLGLDEGEAFAIEYWPLEEAKLRRLPPAMSLAGHVAVVTGGAGGIGRASAEALLAQGACVALLDRDPDALHEAAEALTPVHGRDRLRTFVTDVTDEESMIGAFADCALEFGGVDILVAGAGIASSSAFDETTLAEWNRNLSILATGYFLAAREAFRLMKTQALGGSIIFIGSKNALAASPKAAAYNTAKAAELHLARTLALEGAEFGIRVNTVNPDAVLQGSTIWSSAWRAERARAWGIDESKLEAHYRERSLLKRSVLPGDVAEAVLFFASERSSKSTGNLLNVDAGNAGAFPR
jgi:rhamnulose-1-phosphate aldolase/alcohol dehydrogenase